MDSLFKTPLYEWHASHNAKMAPFAGWHMPIQYQGIIAEHMHTRKSAAVFDICHMGEFLCSGSGAQEALSQAVSHNLDTLHPGRCRYGFLLNEHGGVIDDLIIYCLERDSYMLVVNGARTAVDFSTISQRLPSGVTLRDVSNATAKIDIQGPESLTVLESMLQRSLRHMKYFSFEKTQWQGTELLISRTGYTGELGFELYLGADMALPLWEQCLQDQRVLPAGLGARDTLRLEMGLPLYGQDLDEEHTPAEAGYETMLTSQAAYVGKGEDRRVAEKLIALEIQGRRSARHEDAVALASGNAVGRVTSGSFAPSLGHCIALAYVEASATAETEFLVRTARAELQATRIDLPFFKQGTARIKLDG